MDKDISTYRAGTKYSMYARMELTEEKRIKNIHMLIDGDD